MGVRSNGMNILHVVDLISQQVHGGSAKVPYYLAQEQAKLGHKVTIYASDYQAKEQQPPPGVELVKFRCWWNLLGGIRITPGMLFADFKRFDIVHLHNYRTLPNLIAANKGIPFVVQAHGSCLPMRRFSAHTHPIHNLVWRKGLLRRAKCCIADAMMEIEQYENEGAYAHDIRWVPVGIDLAEYKHLPARELNGCKKILYLGRLHELKGPDILVRAFALLEREDTCLIVAGNDCGYLDRVRYLVRELGLSDRVEYIDTILGMQKLRAYVNADVFVMPSRYEMWGITFMEALACGTPVIMTDKCGAASLLPPECGRVVPLEDEAMAQAIGKMLDDNFTAKHRAYRQKWVSQFSWAKIADTIVKLYEEALSDY